MYTENLMSQIVEKENLEKAIKQVKRNKGKPGIDGMTVEELTVYFVRHGDDLRKQLMARTYKPQPVRRVEIPKSDGRKRLLGIPTVIDRVIQQAVSQILTPIFDKQFSEYSYGFRPHRSAKQAVKQAVTFMNDGYDWVIDIDLERFFDTINHDRLMNLVANTVKDGAVISLIRKFLVSGIQLDGEYQATPEGAAQGGNLSPLLSNIMLNELDKELSRRELKFVRYADDSLIFVKSEMSARRVMRNVSHFIEEKLGLLVNMEKSKIVRPNDPTLKFLGFGFYRDYSTKDYQLKPHQKSMDEFRYKLSQASKRSWGTSMKNRLIRLNQIIRGWVHYFEIGNMSTFLKKQDSHLRYRLRMCFWKLWKTPKNRRKQLRKLGMQPNDAYKNSYSSKSYARIAMSWVMTTTLKNAQFKKLGLISAHDYYLKQHVS